MAFVTLTLKELIDEAEALYSAFSTEEMPLVEQKFKARQLAYVCNKLNNYITFLGKQIIPTTSEREYLEAHCALKGIFRKQPTAAYGSVMVKGLADTVIAAGTVLIRKTDNMRYQTIEEVILTGELQEINVKCMSTGSQGNASEGEVLDFAVVLAGVESTATVKLIGSGADMETDRDLLARYLEVIRNVFHGGADSDYVKWALAVEGVNRAWAYPCELGVGTTTVRIMTPDGFPDNILLQKTKTYIDGVRPPTYNEFYVVSPKEKKIPHTLMIKPDNDDNRAAVLEALTRNYDEQAKPGGLLLLRDLHSAMLSVTALEDYRIDYPTGNIQCGLGEFAVMGETTWTS
jgi:baseplate J-like protein|nr:MAG TPA: Baseplate J like protein [Caudoviricetes sp.]